MASRGLLGRADLLRALIATHELDAKDMEIVAYRLGRLINMHFSRREESVSSSNDINDDEFLDVDIQKPEQEKQFFRPKRFFAVLEAHALERKNEHKDLGLKALTVEDCEPLRKGEAPLVPLVSRVRLWPALKRSITTLSFGQIDLSALVRRLAQRETIRHIPRNRDWRLGGEIVIILDFSDRLIPYEDDYFRILCEIVRLRGSDGMRLWSVDNSPFIPHSGLYGRHEFRTLPLVTPMPPSGTSVLILSDLGLLSDSDLIQEDWRRFCCALTKVGARPVGWLPLSRNLVHRSLALHGNIHCLSGGGDLRQIRPTRASEAGARVEKRDILLACIACCIRVEPALLRAIRKLHPATVVESGLEGLVWSYAPIVVAGPDVCEIGRDHIAHYRGLFSQLPADLQVKILRCMLDHHIWRGRSVVHSEVLIWHAHARREARCGFALDLLGEAEIWFKRMGTFPDQAPGDPVSYARDLMTRHWQDSKLMSVHSALLAPIWAISGIETVPNGFRADDISAALRERSYKQKSVPLSLVQDNDLLFLQSASRDNVRWPVVSQSSEVGWSVSRGSITHRLECMGRRVELPQSSDPLLSEFWLTTDKSQLRVGTLSCQSWAEELKRDRFGIYVNVNISGVIQCFRWIEPGEFWMGSTDTAPGRFGDECPAHLVRITEGFWLADTACSQSLWKAVMGSNPSSFKRDPLNPVECVNWKDVEDFLEAINKQLFGVKASLPTEAEWEFACRAGSQTAFSWGDTVKGDEANYGQRSTVPVKSFRPNAWGLYQMHGNVWEWCADGRRTYGKEVVTNPSNLMESGGQKVVRGGAWLFGAREMRSACRGRAAMERSRDVLGFRFSLRATSLDGEDHPQLEAMLPGPNQNLNEVRTLPASPFRRLMKRWGL